MLDVAAMGRSRAASRKPSRPTLQRRKVALRPRVGAQGQRHKEDAVIVQPIDWFLVVWFSLASRCSIRSLGRPVAHLSRHRGRGVRLQRADPAMPMDGAQPNFFTINGRSYPSTDVIRMKAGETLKVRF